MQRLFDPWVDYGLDLNLKIIPQYLENYSSYAIGKWHLGHSRKEYLPHKRGYKCHYGSLTGCIHHTNHKHVNFIKEAELHDFSENGGAIYPEGHVCQILTNKVLDIFEKDKLNKKFIYLAYLDPHVPLICPNVFKNIDFIKNLNVSNDRKNYLSMIAHLDHQIGRIIKKLKDEAIYDETLIWLMSDNGGWSLDWAGGDNFPFKNGKASFYEGGSRTFSIIKHKDIKIKEFNHPIHCTDVLPTLLSFCNIKLSNKIDGISLFDNLTKNKKYEKRNIILGFFGENHWCFIIDNLKFIKLKKTSNHHMGIISSKIENEDINYIECYDLIKDPEEKNNIIKEKLNLMKDILEENIKKCLRERVYENFSKISEEEIIAICRNTKFWGQEKTKNIKCLSTKDFKEESINHINSKNTLASLTGYDKFYN
jgi:arylsulfatase A-like enzyme